MNPFESFGVTFAWPWLLLLLLAIPLFSFLRGERGGKPTVLFPTVARLRALGHEATSRSGNFLTGLLYFALALLIIGLARPQKGKTLTQVEASGIDIVLALDVSTSMKAEDFRIGGQRATRLEVTRKMTEEFIRKRPNDRIGIIAFAGRPYTVSPLTLDHSWLLRNMERVKIGLVEDGTAIGSAIAAATNRLRSNSQAKSRIVILLTDGDNNRGAITPATAAEAAKAIGVKVYAIGIGGDKPVRVMMDGPYGHPIQVELHPLNVEGLEKVAKAGNGAFYRATDTESLAKIYDEIDQLEKSTFELKKMSQYRDLFPWFVAAGAVLLALHQLLALTVWRKLP